MSRKSVIAKLVLAAWLISMAGQAWAFCGFYVAKADTRLFNKASKVVIARDGDNTAITMANDYQGDPREFALIVPVPQVLKRDQIHVTEPAVIDHIDAYTAPRLVEYFDRNPDHEGRLMALAQPESLPKSGPKARAKSLGVKVEAEYTVGEYDIVILSAQESGGLLTWLTQAGYNVPAKAKPVVTSYLGQGMKFFVAKVNLAKKTALGFTYLRPLRISFTSKQFMLPIRLGMINADGPQELFIFILTRAGRVETANYRTQRIPTDISVPLYVKDTFGAFYRDMFERTRKRESGPVVFLEYAWDMNWCDPCAADPMSAHELKELGVKWLDSGPVLPLRPNAQPTDRRLVFVTRLHMRYDKAAYKDDVVFRETGDRNNMQGRYVLRHPWLGRPDSDRGRAYIRGLPGRFESEAQNLARLTGWDIATIRQRMQDGGQPFDIKLR